MLWLKFILAFCALSYELILAQGLSAFLDNTVLRYSTTIGLYMFAMGAGALFASRFASLRPEVLLWKTEVLLALFGAGSVFTLFIVSGMGLAAYQIIIFAYVMVAMIGALAGMELPLLLAMAAKTGRPARGQIVGVDYAGACAATLIFVFYFYPSAGLVSAVLLVGLCNALAAVLVGMRFTSELGEAARPAVLSSLALSGGLLALWLTGHQLEINLLSAYLGRGH